MRFWRKELNAPRIICRHPLDNGWITSHYLYFNGTINSFLFLNANVFLFCCNILLIIFTINTCVMHFLFIIGVSAMIWHQLIFLSYENINMKWDKLYLLCMVLIWTGFSIHMTSHYYMTLICIIPYDIHHGQKMKSIVYDMPMNTVYFFVLTISLLFILRFLHASFFCK